MKLFKYWMNKELQRIVTPINESEYKYVFRQKKQTVQYKLSKLLYERFKQY